MKRKFKSIFLIVLIFAAAFSCFSEETKIAGLYRYRLDNGLELFVMENDSAPLAYIEIAVRAGAVTQTPENAGLFHLYEHMMFKGNAKYKNQAEAYEALNKMGISSWNGTTGIDRVNYYFTIPSKLIREGLEYWSYAVRTPLMDEKELENEKSVVLSEIEGGMSEPGRIFGQGVFKNLFAESPWKMDPSGNPETVKNASVEQLKKIQEEYYVPSNAGLFVGGAVNHEEVFSLVKEIYGSWENTEASKKVPEVKVPSKSPFGLTKKIVFPDPRNSGQISQLVYYFRGPDAQTDEKDTFAADVWSSLLSNPECAFIKKAVSDSELNIPDADYTGGGYTTMRASGMISFSAAFMNDDKLSPSERALKLLDYWKNQAVEDMLKKGNGYDLENINKVNAKLEDSRTYSLETAEGFLKGFSAEWASSGADYALDYEKNIAAVSEDDVRTFVDKYLKNKNGLAVLFVSPSYYESHKAEFVKSGWKELSERNANWWK